MIIYTTSPFAAPIMLIIWAIDTYVFLASLRLVIGRVLDPVQNPFFRCLRQCTDGLPQIVDRWLTAWRHHSPPSWLSWGIVIGAGFVVRQLLVLLIVSRP